MNEVDTQEKTVQRLNALALAQGKTEQQLLKLTRTVGKLQKEDSRFRECNKSKIEHR